MHSGRNIAYECCVSRSVLYEVLNDVFERKCLFNREIMFYLAFKKDTEKVVIKLEVKGLIKIIEKFRAEKLCVLFYHQTSF